MSEINIELTFFELTILRQAVIGEYRHHVRGSNGGNTLRIIEQKIDDAFQKFNRRQTEEKIENEMNRGEHVPSQEDAL